MSFSIKFTIQSDTRYLALLRQMVSAVAHLAQRKRFPKRACGFCTLALIEAVDNAIFHAHHHRVHVPIDIEIEIRNNAVIMSVVDRGPGLNHPVIDVPQPTATKGRGLYMMTKLVHHVESTKQGRRHTMKLTYRL